MRAKHSFGVTGRSVSTPGAKDRLDDIEGETPLEKEAADRYRANTMRAQHLSSDTPQIQVECRDLARELQQPSNLDEVGLKRLARYLGVRPRLVSMFKWQKRVTRIESRYDTDHAGCIRPSKSVSGCALMVGNSTVCTYCKGQAVIALSSGEAEYYGLVSATSQHSRHCDWKQTRTWSVKHIDNVFLWVQAMVMEGKISLGKKPTKEFQRNMSMLQRR